ncbi:MAG TPA: DUF1343 domain-containing protein [Spirochaetota bacterium]|nr:DUF1343 domain-containing protein [Spirochaetota bacterium]HPR48095.1 DUF1343 domain-containing protein [Spirochaetota bacterium]
MKMNLPVGKIYQKLVTTLVIAVMISCSGTVRYYYPENTDRVMTGIELFLKKYAKRYKGKIAVVITNHSGTNYYLEPNIKLLENEGIDVISILAPEHGLYGYQNEYEKNVYSVDPNFKAVVYNLHKLNNNTLGYLLDKADIVIFDIQDMGMRCYTYISNLKFVMDTLKGTNKELIVMDRPNPIGYLGIDGAYLQKNFKSKFVSAFPAPLIYDMTIGEAARYYRGEFCKDVNLTVINMKNYTRDMMFNETGLPWIPPSPNLPTYTSAIIYTFTVMMEGINISLGRGTAKPFEYIGAPWIEPVSFCRGLENLKLKNFKFKPVYFEPSFSKYKGERCGGAHIFYTGGKFTPSEVSFAIISYLMKTYSKAKWQKYGGKYSVDHLAGTDLFRKTIDNKKSYRSFRMKVDTTVQGYSFMRSRYLMY